MTSGMFLSVLQDTVERKNRKEECINRSHCGPMSHVPTKVGISKTLVRCCLLLIISIELPFSQNIQSNSIEAFFAEGMILHRISH